MGDMESWVENEVELYYNEVHDTDDDFSYLGECARSALRAYKSLLNDGHSGMSIRYTKLILDRLIDGKPLTRIEDTPDVWNEVAGWDDKDRIYQCKRMSSLFKHVSPDGKVRYTDNNYVKCREKDDSVYYSNEFISNLIYELYPLRLPYYGDIQFEVVTEEFLSDKKNGDFDHIGIEELYKNGDKLKDFKPRYFDFTHEDKAVEISEEEFFKRKEKKVDHV